VDFFSGFLDHYPEGLPSADLLEALKDVTCLRVSVKTFRGNHCREIFFFDFTTYSTLDCSYKMPAFSMTINRIK